MDCTNKNCPAYAKCIALYRGSRCKATRATYGLGDPITHYDLLIRKTPEEMAAWIADHPVVSEYDENNPQHKAWLDWLRQEANDVGQ